LDLETILYGYIPITIGLLEIIVSVYLTLKFRKTFNFIFFFLISVSNVLAIYILIQILNGAWPSYLPHFLVLFSTIILITQIIFNKRKKTFANTV
jgi:CHASE2 domain-containing sensor protein